MHRVVAKQVMSQNKICEVPSAKKGLDEDLAKFLILGTAQKRLRNMLRTALMFT